MTGVGASLDAFVARFLAALDDAPHTHFDPDWRSPCEIGEPFRDAAGEPCIAWRPLRRASPALDLLDGLERALELPLHADIKDYYGRYWSAALAAAAPDGPVSLIQLWNDADAARLVENLLGHALAKRRARTPFTVFFATTDPDSDLFLSIDNSSGRILLEEPGRPPLRTVADDLASFLDRLSPTPHAGRVT